MAISSTASGGRRSSNHTNSFPSSTNSSSSTRSICFVQRIEYQFSGSSVWPFALALGDVDNDPHGDYELAVGNVHGDLFIYKHICEQPWKKASNLGSIVCIGIGDVLNEGKNFLVTLSCEGWCHVFDVASEKGPVGHGGSISSASNSTSTTSLPTAAANAASTAANSSANDLFSLYKQNDIGVNVKLLLLDDIDGDGKIELVVGHTDKFVKAYRWQTYLATSQGNDQFASELGSGCVLVDSVSSNEESAFESNLNGAAAGGVNRGNSGFSQTVAGNESIIGAPRGKFVPVYGWRLEHIIGTISVIFWNGRRHLAVAQRGNNYAVLLVDREGDSDPSKYQGRVLYQQISGGRARNTETNCGILGNIRGSSKDKYSVTDYIYHMNSTGLIAKVPLPYASHHSSSSPTLLYDDENSDQEGFGKGCVTPDDTLRSKEDAFDMTERGSDMSVMLDIRDLLFIRLYPIECSGEGREEIVVCARNGMTYIIDHSKNVVKFPFQQDVLAFVAGDFSIRPNCKAPCLVYVTFHNKIMLYYDIKLPRLDSTSLIEMMLKDKEVVNALTKLGIQDNALEQKKLYRKLLYNCDGSGGDL
ncbi:KICSTOR complex protein ITFG2-like isoform X2 [Convolutriloba macropyga]|uniref:KICSTOR complex protein ITFG2-like isoform X2 n=1 Tax=Convolutriloba macropyga TaxID=536237 RepID=UPI003F525114